jgi:hypothetical protein
MWIVSEWKRDNLADAGDGLSICWLRDDKTGQRFAR